ncbi:MAG: ABC-2 type transporter, partial [uncultured Pseudonocardia sp.]
DHGGAGPGAADPGEPGAGPGRGRGEAAGAQPDGGGLVAVPADRVRRVLRVHAPPGRRRAVGDHRRPAAGPDVHDGRLHHDHAGGGVPPADPRAEAAAHLRPVRPRRAARRHGAGCGDRGPAPGPLPGDRPAARDADHAGPGAAAAGGARRVRVVRRRRVRDGQRHADAGARADHDAAAVPRHVHRGVRAAAGARRLAVPGRGAGARGPAGPADTARVRRRHLGARPAGPARGAAGCGRPGPVDGGVRRAGPADPPLGPPLDL